jgi:endogenous inhibitor of DNA gyrase (YacG/DUF329 family)
MTPCPFTPDRLRELVLVDDWRPAQVAVLASAATGERIEEDRVLEWLAAAGIEAPRPRPAVTAGSAVPSRRGVKPGKRSRRLRRARETRPCENCRAPVSRPPSEFRARVYCSHGCHVAALKAAAAENEARRRAEAEQAKAGILPESLPDLKRCRVCRHQKPLREFGVDASKPDLHSGICRTCQGMKNRAYYLANADRLRERARERKAGGNDGNAEGSAA